MAKDENLQLLRATPPPHQPHQREQVPDNEIDQRPEQAALLDHGEPSEPSAPESRERVCEPYAVAALLRVGRKPSNPDMVAARCYEFGNLSE
jgi:hypothetical protein